VDVGAGAGLLISFDVEEGDPRWPAVSGWIKRRRAGDIVRTTFTEAEQSAAAWLELEPSWHHGYPQPDEGSFGYLAATFDLRDYCEKCGVGRRQSAPFQMKREPKWGRRGILQLNWVFDEFFVRPDVWKAVFSPFGVGCRAVLDTQEAELETVVQLNVEEEVDVVTDGLVPEVCDVCDRVKYLPHTRGRFPALISTPEGSMVKTSQWFGSGGAADRRLLVGQALRRALVEKKVRGVSYRPLDPG
jgi:hypothetical protein